LRLFDSVARNLLHDPAVAGIVVNLRDITERTTAQAARARLAAMVEGSNDTIRGATLEGIITDWNRAAEQLFGYSRDEAIGQPVAMLLPTEDQAQVAARIQRLSVGESIGSDEGVAVRKDGSRFDFSLALSHICDSHGSPIGITAIVRAVSARNAQELALHRVNRALKTLSACSSVVVHATLEEQLGQEMCRTIVASGGYPAAWVGMVESDNERSVRPVAWTGVNENFIQGLRITCANTERGRGPTGRCIRSGTPQIVRDIELSHDMIPWRENAEKSGYKSGLSLPLSGPSGAFGVMVIYAVEPDAFDADELALLLEMSADLSFGITSLRTANSYARGLLRLERSMEGTVQALAATVETRDPYTAGHQRRVALIATAIAKEMGLADDTVRELELAASIHDIGKINVPAEILSKPGKLSSIEFELIKTHAEAGFQIVKNIDFAWPVSEIIRQHHERLDGKGYPRGLKAEQILPEAKILAVADVVEAMSSHRPYRQSKGVDTALEEIDRNRGTQFDTDVVDACLKLFRERGFKIAD